MDGFVQRMAGDRLNLILFAVAAIASGAMAIQLVRLPNQVGQDVADPPKKPTPSSLTEADCSSWSDPDDPMNPVGVTTYPRYALLLQAQRYRDQATDFVYGCTRVASASSDPKMRDRIGYQIARYLDVLGLDTDYRAKLEELAPTYPAAAYALAMNLSQDFEFGQKPEPAKRVWDLLRSAYRGGHPLAAAALEKLAPKVFPLEDFNMPALTSLIFVGRFDQIPDTAQTRIAVDSIFEAYRHRCTSWEVIQVGPSDEAAIENYMLPATVAQAGQALAKAPDLLNQAGAWFNNPISSSPASSTIGKIVRIVQDVKSGMAVPSQLMYLVSPEAASDGSKLYDDYKCSGKRSDQMRVNLIGYMRSRTAPEVPPGGPAEHSFFAKRPTVDETLDWEAP